MNIQLVTILSRHWWVLLLRGLAAIAFGVLVWLQPGGSLAVLILLFGAYAMADGILAVWTAIAGFDHNDHWGVLLLGGLVSIGVGVLTFLVPGLSALVLLFYIAAWAIAKGVLEIVAAIRLLRELEDEWLLILGGLASVVFGVSLMAQPGRGAVALIWLIATYAIVFGVLLALLAFQVRTLDDQPTRS